MMPGNRAFTRCNWGLNDVMKVNILGYGGIYTDIVKPNDTTI